MPYKTARIGKRLSVKQMSDDWDVIGPTVEKIIARSKHKYVFSYFTEDDIEQEIRLIAIQAYRKYDKSRGPLENFLARSIANRTKVNLKRDNGFIVQIPCITYKCFFYDKREKCCTWDKMKCVDWEKYTKTYSNKTAVANPALYPDEEMITRKDTDTSPQLDEMLNLAAQRKLKCYKALEDFLKCGKEIPSEHEDEVTQLAIEVAR